MLQTYVKIEDDGKREILQFLLRQGENKIGKDPNLCNIKLNYQQIDPVEFIIYITKDADAYIVHVGENAQVYKDPTLKTRNPQRIPLKKNFPYEMFQGRNFYFGQYTFSLQTFEQQLQIQNGNNEELSSTVVLDDNIPATMVLDDIQINPLKDPRISEKNVVVNNPVIIAQTQVLDENPPVTTQICSTIIVPEFTDANENTEINSVDDILKICKINEEIQSQNSSIKKNSQKNEIQFQEIKNDVQHQQSDVKNDQPTKLTQSYIKQFFKISKGLQGQQKSKEDLQRNSNHDQSATQYDEEIEQVYGREQSKPQNQQNLHPDANFATIYEDEIDNFYSAGKDDIKEKKLEKQKQSNQIEEEIHKEQKQKGKKNNAINDKNWENLDDLFGSQPIKEFKKLRQTSSDLLKPSNSMPLETQNIEEPNQNIAQQIDQQEEEQPTNKKGKKQSRPKKDKKQQKKNEKNSRQLKRITENISESSLKEKEEESQDNIQEQIVEEKPLKKSRRLQKNEETDSTPLQQQEKQVLPNQISTEKKKLKVSGVKDSQIIQPQIVPKFKRVAFSGYNQTELPTKQDLSKLGLELVENKNDLFDILVMKECKRTLKFLIGLIIGAKIVDRQWIQDSLRKKEQLPIDKYIPDSKEFRKQFQKTAEEFVQLRDDYQQAQEDHQMNIFNKYSFIIDKDVKPSRDDIQQLIKLGGGNFLENKPKKKMNNLIQVVSDTSIEEDQKNGMKIIRADKILDSVMWSDFQRFMN